MPEMDGLFKVVLTLLAIFAETVQSNRAGSDQELRCERINIPMCRNVKYNMTSMPNRFHHETQEEAGMEVHQFLSLTKIGCSSLVTEFLCSAYFPICMENYPKPIVPCRSLCQTVRNGCEKLMNNNGFIWPEMLECSLFPEIGDDNNLCLDLQPEPEPKTPKVYDIPSTPFPKPSTSDPPVDVCTCTCPKRNLFDPDSTAANFGGIVGCRPACRSGLIERQDLHAVSWWIGSWTVFCIICTMFIMATFLIDRHRFKYPERPIVIIAFCYFMVALGFAWRLFAGHETVACDGNASRQGVNSPGQCVVPFLLLYFFGMGSCAWWVIICFTWLLTSKLNWTPETVANHSTKFHLVAWAVPFIQTIAVLATSSVDGDPVSGVCYVGQHTIGNLISFVIVPLGVYLVLGLIFLICGAFAMLCQQEVVGYADAEKLRRLLYQRRKVGSFALSAIVPQAALLGCHVYEMQFRDQWDKSLTCRCQETTVTPLLVVFMMKYLCMLLVGIISCLWLVGTKTVQSWKKLCCASSSSKSSDIDLIKSCHTVSIPRFGKSPYPISNV